jgi:hypothetical protein
MQGMWKKLPLTLIAVAAVLSVAGVAFATSSGDNGTTARSAAEPLGDSSTSSPRNDESGDVRGLQETAGGGNGGGSVGSVGGGGGSSNLPFSGFVAIPLLVAGTVLILTGVGLRRRLVRNTT